MRSILNKVLAIALVAIGVVYLAFEKEKIQPENFISRHRDSPAETNLLLLGDSKSVQLKNFAGKIERLLKRTHTKVKVHVYHQDIGTFATACCPAIKLPIGHGGGFEKDRYYAYDSQNRIVETGQISQSAGLVALSILEKTFPSKAYHPPIEPGLDLSNSVFHGSEYLSDPGKTLQLVLFQEAVCFSCPTGKAVMFLNALQPLFPDVSFSFCYMQRQVPQPFVRMLNEAGVDLPIHNPSPGMLAFWQDEKESMEVPVHPLDGVFVGIRDGQIAFVGKEEVEIKGWLEGFNSQNRGGAPRGAK